MSAINYISHTRRRHEVKVRPKGLQHIDQHQHPLPRLRSSRILQAVDSNLWASLPGLSGLPPRTGEANTLGPGSENEEIGYDMGVPQATKKDLGPTPVIVLNDHNNIEKACMSPGSHHDSASTVYSWPSTHMSDQDPNQGDKPKSPHLPPAGNTPVHSGTLAIASEVVAHSNSRQPSPHRLRPPEPPPSRLRPPTVLDNAAYPAQPTLPPDVKFRFSWAPGGKPSSDERRVDQILGRCGTKGTGALRWYVAVLGGGKAGSSRRYARGRKVRKAAGGKW